MRVSVVIASFNEGAALSRTIESCLETADGLDPEIVVADDGSSDGSIDDVRRRFPRVRIVQHPPSHGESLLESSPPRVVRRGARQRSICAAESRRRDRLSRRPLQAGAGALRRLVEDVEHTGGRAIVTPTIPALCTTAWRNQPNQIGHGYFLDLERFHCGWLPLGELQETDVDGRRFYESPAAIGCAFAVARRLYERLWGFDPHMRGWGVEDPDLSPKCWLMGYRILHDPDAVIGHRFRDRFDTFEVPADQFTANQLRMARKNFTQGTWSDWVDRCREHHGGRLVDHPEGLWARIWKLFEADRPSAESERSYLQGRRERDEFWYAERFGLTWPRLHSRAGEFYPGARLLQEGSPSPSPSPSPCPGDPQEEEWWGEVKGIVEPTITFWVNWLREDDENGCPELLICIIRAISWVESRHGHGTGNHAARDPIQVGNPNDAAWKNIGINDSIALGDRPVRQGALPGVSWKNMPGDVNAVINPVPPPDPPVLPFEINPTFLPADGHNNASFTKEMSYFWGIIWYFYSLQQAMPAGQRAAWRLGNCDPENLIAGAVRYNGGGDPDYEQKIKDALTLICCGDEFDL